MQLGVDTKTDRSRFHFQAPWGAVSVCVKDSTDEKPRKNGFLKVDLEHRLM